MSKYRVKEEIAEVFSARSKLDGVLQTLVEQKDDGVSSSPEKESFSRFETDIEIEDYSPLNTPSKKSPRVPGTGGKSGRKRKLGRDEPSSTMEYGQYHHSYIVKLFDRSVDLAQFNEDSPLYPICRAWIRNDPHGTITGGAGSVQLANSEITFEEELQQDDTEREMAASLGYVYELPKPRLVKQELGHQPVNLRIPSPLPHAYDEPQLDLYAEESALPNSKTLLLAHMNRWKLVRQKWKNAARVNELQYADSLNIIKDLYDRHNT